ncbi:hypothetical protein E4U19_007086 [Claviceps sp. Clav32 group G5]|nr:hypothetical protein E4U19_007086 [Claviceps sp. Clav32 group G5]
MHQTDDTAMRQRILELDQKIQKSDQKSQKIDQQIQKRNQQIQEMNQQIQEMDQQIQKMDQQIQEAKRQTRPSTFCEFVEGCHGTLHSELAVQSNLRLETNDSTTTTYSTDRPVKLREWVGFVNEQKLLFDEICDAFPPEHRAFHSPHSLESLRKDINSLKYNSELNKFIRENIEEIVLDIMAELQSLDGIDRELRFGGNLGFAFSPMRDFKPNDESVDLRGIPDSQPVLPTPRDNSRCGPDRRCALSNPTFTRASSTMLFGCDIESPYCLPVEQLREALQTATDVGQASQPTALNTKVKRVLIQSYEYLMESSTGLGILATGQAFVFLRVDWDNPGTLFYHIAAPVDDVAQALASDAARGISQATSKRNSLFLSAVGQYLAFTLMAMRHPRLPGQEARLEIFKHSSGKGPEGETRNSQGQKERNDQNTKSNRLSERKKYRAQDWPYCSQKCLLGLVRGDDLDLTCPNVTLHCQSNAGEADEAGYHHKRHLISHAEWLSLLWDQFEQSIDVGVTYEGAVGSRSILFKVTLLAYGYTFVSKGTVSALIHRLQHEVEIYKQLEPVQGVHVPVFLGTIDLRMMRKNFCVDFRTHVVHMMFLSWGGHPVEYADMVRFEITESRFIEQAEQAMKSVHDMGVIHQHVRWENVLFNSETKGFMIIDFERSAAGQDVGELEDPEKTRQQRRLTELRSVAYIVQEEIDDHSESS